MSIRDDAMKIIMEAKDELQFDKVEIQEEYAKVQIKITGKAESGIRIGATGVVLASDIIMAKEPDKAIRYFVNETLAEYRMVKAAHKMVAKKIQEMILKGGSDKEPVGIWDGAKSATLTGTFEPTPEGKQLLENAIEDAKRLKLSRPYKKMTIGEVKIMDIMDHEVIREEWQWWQEWPW